MDLAEKRKLEIEIDRMSRRAKDPAVEAACKEAQVALRRNDYDKAKSHLDRAREFYVEETPVVQVLVDAGKAKTAAEARRYIERGQVRVDGTILRQHGALVRADQSVVFRGAELRK